MVRYEVATKIWTHNPPTPLETKGGPNQPPPHPLETAEGATLDRVKKKNLSLLIVCFNKTNWDPQYFDENEDGEGGLLLHGLWVVPVEDGESDNEGGRDGEEGDQSRANVPGHETENISQSQVWEHFDVFYV